MPKDRRWSRRARRSRDPFAPDSEPDHDAPGQPGASPSPTTSANGASPGADPFAAGPPPGSSPFDAAPAPGPSSSDPAPSPFDAHGIADAWAPAGHADLDPSIPEPGPLAGGGPAPDDDPTAARSELAQARHDRMVAAAGLDPAHDLSPHGRSVLDWLSRQDDAVCSGVVEVLQATGQATIRHLRERQG